jgi:Cerato-platanin
MKFFSIAAAFALAIPAAFADSVRYDQTYDNSGQSLSTVSCSDGPNGLLTKGFTTFGSLPTFPNIGAAAAVAGWNSAECGSCWKLTYNGQSVTVIAMDHAGDGFNLSLESMNTLTDGQAEFLGTVQATVESVDASQCGL